MTLRRGHPLRLRRPRRHQHPQRQSRPAGGSPGPGDADLVRTSEWRI